MDNQMSPPHMNLWFLNERAKMNDNTTLQLIINNKSLEDLGISKEYKEEILAKILEIVRPATKLISRTAFEGIVTQAQEDNKTRELQIIQHRTHEQRLSEQHATISHNYGYLIIEARKHCPSATMEFAIEPNEIVYEPGIYFLIQERQGLVYIGEAQNIGKRLNTNHHVYKSGDFLVGQVYSLPNSESRKDVEMELIQLFRPPQNKQINRWSIPRYVSEPG